MYIYTYSHIYTYMYTYQYILICMHTNMYTDLCTYILGKKYTQIRRHNRIVCRHTYTNVHMYIHTHMHRLMHSILLHDASTHH